jgi:dienelactone hydrolase
MKRCLAGFVWLVAGVLSAVAPAQQPPAPASAPPRSVPAVQPTTPIGSGPYLAIMEANPDLPTHTLYRPADLGSAGKMPIVAWGNGACFNIGNSFRWFLSDIASYGYLVIAVGPIGTTPQFPPESMAPIPPVPAAVTAQGAMKLPPPATHSAQLIDAINWALAENERGGSPFYHRLDTHDIAVMGQSCGGVQAIEASADPRVRTTMVWNSGLFNQPTAMAGGKTLTKENLKLLHGPTAYISGDAEDIAFANANDDFDHIDNVPLLRAYGRGITHGGTYNNRNGGEFAGVAVAWLNWQLKGDARAAKMFVGPDCGLCVNPHWVVRSRNLH